MVSPMVRPTIAGTPWRYARNPVESKKEIVAHWHVPYFSICYMIKSLLFNYQNIGEKEELYKHYNTSWKCKQDWTNWEVQQTVLQKSLNTRNLTKSLCSSVPRKCKLIHFSILSTDKGSYFEMNKRILWL